MRFSTSTISATARAVGVSVILIAGSLSQSAAAGMVRPLTRVAAPSAPFAAAAAGRGVYVVTGTTSGTYVIREYGAHDSSNRPPLCSIFGGSSDFPGSLATDRDGNLWVPTIATPSTGSVWEVVEYAPGCGAPLQALSDPGEPIDIAFDSRGTAFVGNEVGGTSFGPGNIAVYPAGQTSPSRILTSPLIGGYVSAIAVNANGDVFCTCDTASYKTQVVEFPKGRGKGTLVNVSGYSVILGITFDNNQNMILTDYELAQDEVYAPPYSGAPTATIPLVAGSKPNISKLNRRNDTLYVTGGSGSSALNVYSYPSGTYEYSVTNGMSQYGAGGMAIDPRARN